MGCTSVKVVKTSIQTGSDFSIALSTSLTQKRKNSVTPCMKFTIPEDEEKVLNIDLDILQLDNALSESKICRSLLEECFMDYQNINAREAYFEHVIHKSCIPNYTIEYGILVLLVHLNILHAKYTKSSESPFIVLENTQQKIELYDAWREYSEMIAKYNKKYRECKSLLNLQAKILRKINRIEEFKDKNSSKRRKYLIHAEAVIAKFITKVSGGISMIHRCMRAFKKMQITVISCAEIASKESLNSCEKIVHGFLA